MAHEPVVPRGPLHASGIGRTSRNREPAHELGLKLAAMIFLFRPKSSLRLKRDIAQVMNAPELVSERG